MMKLKINLKKNLEYFLYFIVFFIFLPGRKFLFKGMLNNAYWEWGSIFLYITDIFLFLFIFFFVFVYKKEIIKKNFWFLIWQKYKILISGFIVLELFFLVSALNSLIPFLVFYLMFRLLELFLFFLIINIINFDYIKVSIALLLSASLESVLALYQWIEQANPFFSKILSLHFLDPSKSGVAVIEYAKNYELVSKNVLSWTRWLRAYGTFPHPNALAGFLLVVLFLVLLLYLHYNYGFKKLFTSLFAVLIFVGMLLSFSRASWLVFSIVFIFLFLYMYFYKKYTIDNEKIDESIADHSFDILKYLILIISVVIVFVVVYPDTFYTRTHLNTRLEEYSYKDRLWQYKNFINLFKISTVFGLGANQSTLYLSPYNVDLDLKKAGGNINLSSYIISKMRRKSINFQPIHNLYLLILLEWGIFAFLIFAFFIMYLLYLIYKNRKYFREDFLFLSYVLSFVVILILSIFDHYWLTIWPNLLLFVLILSLLIKKLYFYQYEFNRE